MLPSEKPAILFVCTGNIIRSPIAEAVFRRILQRFPSLKGWEVGSAGVQGLVGSPADPKAITVVRGLGIDLNQHVARNVTQDLLDNFDLILTMEKNHKVTLAQAYVGQADKIHFMGELTGDRQDVFDPISAPLQDYLAAARDIENRLERRFLRIIMASLVYSLKRLGLPFTEFNIFPPFQLQAEEARIQEEGEEIEWFFRLLIGLPLEDQYDLLLVLHQLQPYNEEFFVELHRVAEIISPPKYERRWLKEIFQHEIVLPITCLTKMKERQFVHPAIQDELDQISARLNDPDCQPLFRDLEKIFARKLSEQKYRLNIWDLITKYKYLPHQENEYEMAYHSMHHKYHL